MLEIKSPECPKCKAPMALFASWAESQYIPEGRGVVAMGPITARTFQCSACLLPVHVDCCPSHQKELVLREGIHTDIGTVTPTGEMADVRRWRPYSCGAEGCTYEKWYGSRPPRN